MLTSTGLAPAIRMPVM